MEGRELPEAVAMDILSRLPVKSLARFRCVCKPWASSFQTSYFITKHHHNNVKNNNLNLLLKHCRGATGYLCALSTEKGRNFQVKENIESCFYNFDPQVHGPCNGLLCLGEGNGKVGIWNPSTREFKIIPIITVPRPPTAIFTSFGCLGFGYDSITDDYKLVRLVINLTSEYEGDDDGGLEGEICQAVLYSLNTDSWKEISCPQVFLHSFTSSSYYYMNWFCYWRVTGDSEHMLLSFDIANEKFSTLPLPNSGENLGHLLLFDFNGLLGAMVCPRDGTEKSLDLWVMNGSWTKQSRIEPIPGVERPLGFWKNGEIFLESSNHELVLFDPATTELKNLGIYARREEMQLIAYFESLVPINGESEDEETIIRLPAAEASSGH